MSRARLRNLHSKMLCTITFIINVGQESRDILHWDYHDHTAKNTLCAIVPVLKNKIIPFVDSLSTFHYEYTQHEIDNENGIGLHCMASWTESLPTPQLTQNDEVHKLGKDDSIQFSAENAMKEMDDADSHEQTCEDVQSTWES